jgi:hypothetical protein
MFGDRIRRAIERWLPWYSPEDAARGDRRSRRIHLHSISVRIRAEHVVESYRRADGTYRR